MFRQFEYIENYNYSKGWDKYALDYQNLLVNDTVYYLTKEIMHTIVAREVQEVTGNLRVLDVNCGTGNDFPFFFEKNWSVTGCDGSTGMLNKAWEKYEDHIDSGNLELYSGLLENLKEDTFPHGHFDLIFSVTGGFSYIPDTQLINVNRILKKFMKNDGVMITAHLNNFCLPEMAYRTMRLKNPFYRLKESLKVNIKDEPHRMYLRNVSRLKKCYLPVFPEVSFYPLLAFTPPYQTNYEPGLKTLNFFRSLERWALKRKWLSHITDQIVCVCKKQVAD